MVLPDVFDRFKEAAARSSDLKKGLDALLSAENLNGLPPVFGALSLLRDEKGKTVFRVDSGALAEVLARIEERANYGETASGRYLADEFAKEPFGWEFEATRLFVLCLLRAGKIEGTTKGQTIDSATSIDAKDTFSNNNFFRQASFRPKKGIEFAELVKAADAFKDTFGAEIKDLSNPKAVAEEIRKEIAFHEDTVINVLALLTAQKLPGRTVLEDALGQIKAIVRGSDENAIAIFNASHKAIKDAIKRSSELSQCLTEPCLNDLSNAREALSLAWPFLMQETDLDEKFRLKAEELSDLLSRETFFRELPAIEQDSHAITGEYERRYQEALNSRIECYQKALAKLTALPNWLDIDSDQRQRISAPLQRAASPDTERVSIPQLRSEREACDSRFKTAVSEVHRLLDGERIVTVSAATYFAGGIETEEQLDSALDGIREECSRLIGAGKKILLQ